ENRLDLAGVQAEVRHPNLGIPRREHRGDPILLRADDVWSQRVLGHPRPPVRVERRGEVGTDLVPLPDAVAARTEALEQVFAAVAPRRDWLDLGVALGRQRGLPFAKTIGD